MAQFVVEATDWERHELWGRHAQPESRGASRAARSGLGSRVRWLPHLDGDSAVVGELAGRAVAIRVTWADIEGFLVMFWSPCSRVVDHDLCHDWLKANVPAYVAGRNGDAASFHECLAFVREVP